MSESSGVPLSPRTRRHLKSLIAGLAVVLAVFFVVFYFLPSSLLNSVVPTAFALSISIVSIFIAIYSFTSPEHWYPEDIRHIVLTSDSSDWEFKELDGGGEQITYKTDRSINIRTNRVSERMGYHESWMDVYPETEGTRYKASILKDGHEYDYCYLVWVDGKTLVPEPIKWGGDTVSELGYRVGRLIEMARAEGIRPSPEEQEKMYEEALDMAGITVND